MSKNINYTASKINETLANAIDDHEKVDEISSKVTDLSESVTSLKSDKANTDGYYEEMTVGSAENLLPTGTATEEYITSKSFDSTIDDGEGVIKTLKGNTIVMNQLVEYPNLTSHNYPKTHPICNVSGHKVIIYGYAAVESEGATMFILLGNTSSYNYHAIFGLGTEPTFFSKMYTSEEFVYSVYNYISLQFRNTSSVSAISTIDLTQMFGSGNEPSTEAEFAARLGYPSIDAVPYFDYNEGELVSMRASGVKSTGRNLWDEEWVNGYYSFNDDGVPTISQSTIYLSFKNIVKVTPNTTYYIKCPVVTTRALFLGTDGKKVAEMSYIGNNNTFTTPKGCCGILISFWNTSTYNNDICINISDASFNGTYEPYEEHTRSLHTYDIKDADGNQLFPEGLKSAGTVYDEVTRTKAVKRIGKVDLGTLSWTYNKFSDTIYYFSSSSIDSCIYGYTVTPNGICKKYICVSRSTFYIPTDKSMCFDNGMLKVIDTSYTDAATFKAAISGVYLYYELDTQIEVDLDDWNGNFKEWKNGTAEVVSEANTTALRADIIHGRNYAALAEKNESNIAALAAKKVSQLTDEQVTKLLALIETSTTNE